jgi:hypothetical protein
VDGLLTAFTVNLGQLVDQGAFARARRTGYSYDVSLTGIRVKISQGTPRLIPIVLDHGDETRHSPPVSSYHSFYNV